MWKQRSLCSTALSLAGAAAPEMGACVTMLASSFRMGSHSRGGVGCSRWSSTTKDAVDIRKDGHPTIVQGGTVQHQVGCGVCCCAGGTGQRD